MEELVFCGPSGCSDLDACVQEYEAPLFTRNAVSLLMLSFLVEHAQAGVVVFDNCDAFDMFSDALGVRNESLDFTAYEGAFSSLDIACSLGTVGLRSSSGLQGVLGSYMKADSIGETLVIDFEEEVRSVGGFFFLVDEFQLPEMGLLELTLSDGNSYVASLTKDGGFAGFISTTANIESLSLRGFGPSMFAAPAVSSLKLGVVPSPAGLALLGIAGVARRRRRSV
jgi:hypothetical protein